MLEKIMPDIERMKLNLYDIAVITDTGLEERRCQPSNACNNSYSVAKLFTAAAVGMLREDGLLDLNEPVFDTFQTDFATGYDKRWEKVTIGHALTHRIGFDRGFLDIDVEDIRQYGTTDFLSIVLSRSLNHEPGSHFQYSDAAFYLLSRLVEKKAGVELDALLMDRLLLPLQFQEVAWSRCPMGHPIGATGLYIRAQDMVKLGWVYLNGGMWHGRRLLPNDWICESIDKGYEVHRYRDTGLIAKLGMNGQALLFSPEKRFAVAWHAYEPEGSDVLIEYLAGCAAL